MKQNAERSILTAAKLIAPVIDDTFAAGNKTCIVVGEIFKRYSFCAL